MFIVCLFTFYFKTNLYRYSSLLFMDNFKARVSQTGLLRNQDLKQSESALLGNVFQEVRMRDEGVKKRRRENQFKDVSLKWRLLLCNWLFNTIRPIEELYKVNFRTVVRVRKEEESIHVLFSPKSCPSEHFQITLECCPTPAAVSTGAFMESLKCCQDINMHETRLS